MNKKFLLNVHALLGLAIMLSVVAMSCNSGFGKKISIGNNEVFYKNGATEPEAKKLGAYLREGGKYFDDSTRFSVQLEKKSGEFITRFVVDKDKVKSVTDIKDMDYDFIPAELSKNVFDGQPVIVEVTDNQFVAMKTYAIKK